MDEDATIYWVDPATKQKTKVGVAKAYGGELAAEHASVASTTRAGTAWASRTLSYGRTFVLLTDEEW